MIQKIKNRVHRLLESAGYSVSRKVVPVYEELLDVPRYEEQLVQLEGQDFKVADAHSFRHSFEEIFGSEIYRFPCAHEQPRIVDCGANYGTSVVYFKKIFPLSSITAVECDPEVFEILKWNVGERDLKKVELINKAVSDSERSVRFFREGADSGRLLPHQDFNDSVEIETIQLDDLLSEPVDFLKMDIEGEEVAALLGSKKLENVRSLFVEYHSFTGRPQGLELLLGKLVESGFRYHIQTQFCSPRPLVEPSEYLGMDLQLNIFATR